MATPERGHPQMVISPPFGDENPRPFRWLVTHPAEAYLFVDNVFMEDLKINGSSSWSHGSNAPLNGH